jgi:hypothetical protein
MIIGKFLTEYLLGNFGDNSWLLWEGIKNKYGLYSNQDLGLYGYTNNSLITEPFTYYPFLFLSYFVNSIFLWNLFVILFISLSFYFTYILFKKNNSRFDSFLFSAVWISNAYFSFHSREHLSLLAGFLFPIYLLIEEGNNKNKLLFKFFFLIFSLGISNYIGVFLVFINFIYSIYKFFSEKNKSNKINLFLSAALCILLSISLKIYFSDIQRNIDNFTIFSFKPWHLLIQPDRALFKIYNFDEIFINKNNILFTYFEVEHSASFFGILVFILLGFSLWKNKNINKKFLILLITTLVITLPPTLTVKGITIFTPSYLFFLLFDQFRVTARFNIFSFLLILLMIGPLFKSLKDTLKNNLLKILLCLIIFIEIFVPFKVTPISTNQEVYKYIRENTKKESLIIIYPYDSTNIVFKDMIFIQRKIVNPYGYEIKEKDFSSKIFTRNLSCREINNQSIKTDDLYIVEFQNSEGLKFQNSEIEKLFEEDKVKIYKVNCNE